MSRPATGRTTKLVRVPIRFEAQVKALIQQLKEEEILQHALSRKQVQK